MKVDYIVRVDSTVVSVLRFSIVSDMKTSAG